MANKMHQNGIAFINVDMDTLNDYSIFCNIPANISNDKTLEVTVPRFIDLFEELGVKATFFVIGNNAVKNKKYVRMLYENGHEIGNQTLSHQIDIGKLSAEKKYNEIVEADKILSDIVGRKIVGFRAPNYLIDKETWDILKSNGYLYDSSVFPTISTPFFEIYDWIFFGRFCRVDIPTMFKPVTPYFLNNGLLEIPVSATPLTRLPFIGSYIQKLGWLYFKVTFQEFLLLNKNINFELHAYELLSKPEDNIPYEFDLLPRIKHPLNKRYSYLLKLINAIKKHYKIITLEEYAKGFENENSNRNS